MEGTRLLPYSQLLGVPGQPGIDLIVGLPQDDASAARCQIRLSSLHDSLHIGLRPLLKNRVEAVQWRGILWHTVIAPLAVNIGPRAQDDPKSLISEQIKKTKQIAARVSFPSKVVATGFDFMEVPADVGRERLQAHLARAPQNSPPVGWIKPPVMHFPAEQGNIQIIHPYLFLCDANRSHCLSFCWKYGANY